MSRVGKAVVLMVLAACADSSAPCDDASCPAADASLSTAEAADGGIQAAGDANAVPADPATPKPAALTRAGDCPSLLDEVRARTLERVLVNIEEYARVRENQCTDPSLVDFGGLRGVVPAGGISFPSGPSAVSRPNHQVENVEEADIVKSDGRTTYFASRGVLRVIETWPAESARELTRLSLGGAIKQLLLAGDRLVVYVSVQPVVYSQARGLTLSRSACTYGYLCDFTGDGAPTRIVVFDVSNRAQPVAVREIAASGSLIAARRIGDVVHTVLGTTERSFNLSVPNELVGGRCDSSAEHWRGLIESVKQQARDRIMTADLAEWLPKLTDTVDSPSIRACTSYAAQAGASNAFTTLHSFDVRALQPAIVTNVMTRPGAVYVSDKSLYMSVREHARSLRALNAAPPPESSIVHRFSVGADVSATRYEASGRVPGYALNQFALDEWQDHLRIATSTGRVGGTDVHSTLSVLEQRGQELHLVGQVDRIAPSEDIRSVRFVGPRGYVVTFKKTDPLFVFDLSTPSAPRVLSELKVDGFSTYMHPLDDKHLLTIGYDAADQGAFAFFTGIQLQIFDVADAAHPRLAHKTVIGTRGSSSAGLTNHLAFTYVPEKKLLSLPMTICEVDPPSPDAPMTGATAPGRPFPSASASFGRMKFSGLMLFDVDTATGLRERGRVAHPRPDGSFDDASCSNWWTNANSVVQRSIVMDDFVYSFAEDIVRIQSLNALGSDVRAVPLPLASCFQDGSEHPHGAELPRGVLPASCACRCIDGKVTCIASDAAVSCEP